jgi:hypothetical protein
MIMVPCDRSTTSIGGKSAKAIPGSLTRLGPRKRNGDTRFDDTGSSQAPNQHHATLSDHRQRKVLIAARNQAFAKCPFIGSSPTSNAQRNDPADFDFATPSDAASGTCARG